MAHGIDGRKLGRKHGPRMALYRNLVVSILRYEQVRTTRPRQGGPRPGRADDHPRREGSLDARRRVVAELPNEPLVVDKLFREIGPKYADRTSGFTRIVRLGQRVGDAARSSRSSLSEAGQEAHTEGPARPARGTTPETGHRKKTAEREAPCGTRTGRIRRNGVLRVPGAAWRQDRPG